MGSLLQDLRFGARILSQAPGITISIIVVLALGIGANSAMFGIVDGLLLHPVDYPNADELVFVWNHDAQGVLGSASAANFIDWRKQAKSLSEFSAWIPTSFVASTGNRPRQLGGARVTANFFKTLNIKPVLGRTFLPDEDGLDKGGASAQSVLISYRLWREDLGSDPNVLGRTIRVDSVPYAVVGVMPANFQFWWRAHDIWIPVSLNIHDRDYHNLVTIARLNAPRAQAQAEMNVIGRALEVAYPKSNRGWTIEIADFQESLLNGTYRTRLLLLFGAVGLVLLIACTNVANLLLARSAAREREIAVRMSLGASGIRLTRQLLTESTLLSLTGGFLGLALAWAVVRAAPSIVPSNAIPGASVQLNTSVYWFTIGISLLTGILFGLAPAITATRADFQDVLKDASRGSTPGRGRQRFGQIMVTGEVALAVMLLAGAGLMIESLGHLSQIDPGYDPRNVLAVRLFLPTAKYNEAQALRFQRNALDRVGAIPGVKSVTEGSSLPLQSPMEVPFDMEGAPPRGEGERPGVPYIAIGPAYLQTLGIPLKRGRSFAETDNETAPPVAMVNEALVDRYFQNQDPIGKRILINRPIRGQNGFSDTLRIEVVGVVGNVRMTDLSTELRPIIYIPHPQNAFSQVVWLAARTDRNPFSLASAIRNELMSIDPEQPIEQVNTLEQMLSTQLAQPRFQTQLMGAFALLALVLAAIGIYGINAYSVVQRRHEIGVRLALGATSGTVLKEILAQGMRLTAIGIAAGLIGSVAIASILKSILIGVSATDPVTLLAVALLLAIVAALACYIPARRATQIDPATALRPE